MIVWFSWIISICEIHGEYRTAGHLVFWKPWPAIELKKVLSVTNHGFIFWTQHEPNTILEIYKAFQDRLTFLNRHMIVWFSWIFLDLWNLLKRQDCRPFSILKNLTGYQPYSHRVKNYREHFSHNKIFSNWNSLCKNTVLRNCVCMQKYSTKKLCLFNYNMSLLFRNKAVHSEILWFYIQL